MSKLKTRLTKHWTQVIDNVQWYNRRILNAGEVTQKAMLAMQIECLELQILSMEDHIHELKGLFGKIDLYDLIHIINQVRTRLEHLYGDGK